MINLRASTSFLLLSWLLGGCGMLDSSSTKKTAPIGLISTPISYYSTPKAKYLGTKYKENLDRLVEQIVRNPKTATLQFANNISSVGGIGFFTHSATKTSDERYLEVVLATPETFETKGEYSEKIQRLFSLYGFDLLNIMNSDRDIYQDRELAGYGLNLAWRNVVRDPSSGDRVMLARAIIYLPKEKVQSYLRSEIQQNDLLAGAVIFGEEEDGPLALVSYRPQDPRPDFRPPIQEDNLAVGNETKPDLAKQSIGQANQKPESAKGDGSRAKPASIKPSITGVDSKGEAVNATAQAPAPDLAERNNPSLREKNSGNGGLVAASEAKEGAEPSRPGSSENQIESVPQLSAPAMANSQPQPEQKTSAVTTGIESTSEQQVALGNAGSTELSKASNAKSQTPQPEDLSVTGLNQAVTTMTAQADAIPSPKPTVTVSKTNAEPATAAMAKLSGESSAIAASENGKHTYPPQQSAEQKSQEQPIAPSVPADMPQPIEKDEMTALQSPPVQAATKSDTNVPVAKATPTDNSLNAKTSTAIPSQTEKLPSNSSSFASASTSQLSGSDLNQKVAAPVPIAPVRQPIPVPEVRSAPEQLAALKKPGDMMVEKKAITRPAARALEGFIIQIAFNDKDKAQHWAETMERRGYAVSVTETGSDGALRVRLGNFSIRDEAERQLRTFKQEGMNGIIINLPQAFQPARSSVP